MDFNFDINGYLQKPIWGGLKWDLDLEKRIRDEKYLEAFGYKVYSQNDEDGIIHEIFKRIGVVYKNFVEFGVDTGLESNCHALLLQNWNGLWIEGRKTAFEQLVRRFAPVIRRKKLSVLNRYVTKDNIDQILNNFTQEGLDLLSIDVDGNDWYVWNAVTSIKPRVVVIEYNGKFTPEIDWKMAYNEYHVWDGSDRVGASLKALENLGREKGYQLVGTNITGINAFFVRSDLTGERFALPATSENLYNPARMNVLVHHNGHPSRNYVGSDIEGMEGIFEYYPDWNCLPSYGFWKPEVNETYKRYLLSQKKAQIFVRLWLENIKIIRINYDVSVPTDILEETIHIKVIVKGQEKEFVVDKQNGFFDMSTEGTFFENGIFAINVETNLLWVPDTLIHNGDKRKQGIAINNVEYL